MTAMVTGSVLCRVRGSMMNLVICSTSLYDVLEVPRNATAGQIKTAYRKLALQHHPDVSTRSDSQEKFIELSNAYEILVDDLTRATYDTHGLDGLRYRMNKGSAWDVWNTWDEFKPFQRTTRKGDARSSSASRKSTEGFVLHDQFNTGSQLFTEAQLGDLVEYNLSDAAKAQHNDGRLKGVGLVVSRNIDRGDRHKLPLEINASHLEVFWCFSKMGAWFRVLQIQKDYPCVDLVELEPLYKEPDSEEWRADPMEGPAFASMTALRILRSDYEQTRDVWKIHDELSPDCGSPVYAEEVIL